MSEIVLWLLEWKEAFRNWMVWHEQSSDDLALQNMPFHDLCDVSFCTHPVPHSLRIDHDTWAELTMIEATGLVCSDETFEIQPFRFALEVRMKFF